MTHYVIYAAYTNYKIDTIIPTSSKIPNSIRPHKHSTKTREQPVYKIVQFNEYELYVHSTLLTHHSHT